jgi:uncharacterized protein YjbI with pentapeptide repeats
MKINNKLQRQYDLHQLYLAGGPVEGRLNWSGKDLRGIDLRGADLRGAILRGTNLHLANLEEADLFEATLTGP